VWRVFSTSQHGLLDGIWQQLLAGAGGGGCAREFSLVQRGEFRLYPGHSEITALLRWCFAAVVGVGGRLVAVNRVAQGRNREAGG
jgi:hypothetical protein